MLGEDALQHGGAVVEGDGDMADLALLLHPAQEGKGIQPAAFFIIALVEAVEEVIVEKVDAAGRQLPLEKGGEIVGALHHPDGQLVCNLKAVPRIPLHQALAQGCLAHAAVVGLGRIEIQAPSLDEAVHQRAGLFHIDALVVVGVQQRQTQKSIPQIAHIIHILPRAAARLTVRHFLCYNYTTT